MRTDKDEIARLKLEVADLQGRLVEKIVAPVAEISRLKLEVADLQELLAEKTAAPAVEIAPAPKTPEECMGALKIENQQLRSELKTLRKKLTKMESYPNDY